MPISAAAPKIAPLATALPLAKITITTQGTDFGELAAIRPGTQTVHLQPDGPVYKFEGTLADAKTMAQKVASANGAQNTKPLFGPEGTYGGSWKLGNKIPIQDPFAIYATEKPDTWHVQRVFTRTAKGNTMLELDPLQGSGDSYTRTIEFSDVRKGLIALVDRTAVVDIEPTTNSATLSTSGTVPILSYWIDPAPVFQYPSPPRTRSALL
jgi:hypothetical protein